MAYKNELVITYQHAGQTIDLSKLIKYSMSFLITCENVGMAVIMTIDLNI